jgi:formylglycine-generating enzyme required for sulfatase activity
MVGTFGVAPCTAQARAAHTADDGTPLFDEEVCVPGGAFLMGNRDTIGRDASEDLPLRIALIPPFRMDRYEVTVGRWRQALGNGFVPIGRGPSKNEGALDGNVVANGTEAFPGSCTFSMFPRGRETMPINCVSVPDAQAFCQFIGGDFPTEAQFEYATQDAGRSIKTYYAWGDEGVTCERVIFGRLKGATFTSGYCASLGAGPAAVDAVASPDGDMTGLGIVDLAGSMTEMTADAFYSLGSVCWASASLTSPTCNDPKAPQTALRGGAWSRSISLLPGGWRAFTGREVDRVSPANGFRCVRSVD